MTDRRREGSIVARLARDVGHAIAVDITKAAVYFIGGTLFAALALLVFEGGSLPAWVIVAALALPVAIGVAIYRPVLGELRAERSELKADTELFAEALVRHEEYSGHVAQALDALQRILSDELAVDIPDYVELGVLQPARDLITDKPAEHVRLSVLLPRADAPDRWMMPWTAGHTVTGKAKYNQRIVDTVSRHACARSRFSPRS